MELASTSISSLAPGEGCKPGADQAEHLGADLKPAWSRGKKKKTANPETNSETPRGVNCELAQNLEALGGKMSWLFFWGGVPGSLAVSKISTFHG